MATTTYKLLSVHNFSDGWYTETRKRAGFDPCLSLVLIHHGARVGEWCETCGGWECTVRPPAAVPLRVLESVAGDLRRMS